MDAKELEDAGRVWLRGTIPPDDLERLALCCDVGRKPGIRLEAKPSLMRTLADCAPLSEFLGSIGLDTVPTRLVAFNKSLSSNWSVPWHQDRVIAVRDRIECDGFASWVPKDGFWHCEPPIALLENMVFVRIHLDAADEKNGTFQLALGSHKHGLIPSEEAAGVAEASAIEACHAKAGDILIVKALLLHRSARVSCGASSVDERRALRIDYANKSQLSPPLDWAIH